MGVLFEIIIYSILFAITMKIGDLFNEHGMKPWFPGSALFFGFFYGIIGLLLVFSDNILANVILAMIIGYVLRHRIDYLNHGIAASIIIIGFLYRSVFDINIFIPFFLAFAIFGLTEDFISEKLKKKIKIPKRLPFYTLTGIVFGIIAGNWIILLSLFLFEFFYVITDIFGMKFINHQNNSLDKSL
ncbi:hypothetical protein KKA23_02715 [Patescibacteria group bacterium]|nr:hypothetical protein [Patescibacteria group bacterium]